MNESAALKGLYKQLKGVLVEKSDDDDDKNILCKNCGKEMTKITADEGDVEVNWCHHCGSLALTGEADEFYKIGEKPKWSK